MNNLLQMIESREVEKGVVLWWLGGASYVLKTRQAIIYVDLFTGPAPTDTLTKLTKDIPDLISPPEINNADLVLSTHEHIDHCHRESLVPIYGNTKAIFVGPPSSVRHFKDWGFDDKRIVELRSSESFRYMDMHIQALPNKDIADEDALSYLLQIDEINIYEGGDSLYFDGFKSAGNQWDIDIALLNFFANPPELDIVPSMVPAEVAQAAKDLGVSYLIPKHWDIWKEMKGDPAEIVDALKGSSVNPIILQPGVEFVYQQEND